MSIHVLEQVRDELKSCNAISSNREFCERWLAKDESYLRVLKFNNLDASADALATCASKLGYYMHHLNKSDNSAHQDWALRFERLRELCHTTLERQARSKWMTPERMGL
jgi:hypothetical protein